MLAMATPTGIELHDPSHTAVGQDPADILTGKTLGVSEPFVERTAITTRRAAQERER